MAKLEDRLAELAKRREEEEADDAFEAAAGGEVLDSATREALDLAHRVVKKFPELSGKYKTYAGAAVVVSSVATVLAGIAIARRMRRGQTPERILAELTPEEIERAATVPQRQQRWMRMLRRVARRRTETPAEGAPSGESG